MLREFVEQWMSLGDDAQTVVLICFVLQVLCFKFIIAILQELDQQQLDQRDNNEA